MTQTLLPPAVNSYVALPEEPLRAISRSKEDPKVTEMERKSHRVKTLTLSVMPLVAAAALIAFVIYGATLPDAHGQSDLAILVNNFQRWAVSGVMIMAAVLCIFMSDLSDSKKVRENKAIKKGIHGARNAAQKLGSEIVPFLTASHVEARIRIDDALRIKLDESKTGWKQGESDEIGVLLFRDLNREPVIASLITDRGMTTSKEIEAALLESESNTAAPVRSGWL